MNNTKDIVAGIPSFNNQNTISFVTEQIGRSMEKYYKNKQCMIVDCDGGSTDKTLTNFLKSKTKIEKRVIQTSLNNTGKGNVFKLLFKEIKKYNAKIGIVNDSDLRSINPEWFKLQADSILKKKYDYAVPYYYRYKYDGQITKHVCYPLMYGLFCRDIRHPIGGDFAFSSKLVNHWLSSKWSPNTKLFGIDIFMTSNALLGNFKVCQVNLKSKVHDAKDPAKSLGPMFAQVLSTFFDIIINNKYKLRKLNKVKKVPIFGPKGEGKPQEFNVDTKNMKNQFTKGFTENKKKIEKILQKENYNKIQKIIKNKKINIDNNLWTKIVYDYIIAYKRQKGSSFVLRSFTSLWLGRIYTFVNETLKMDTKQAEVIVKKQAKEFFKQRDYLFEKL